MMPVESSGPRQLGVRFLGEFSVSLGGREITSWQAGKARNLLQYLLLHHGHVVPAERLQEMLWPQAEVSSSLKVAAHALRHVLCRDLSGFQESGLRIDYQNGGYVIHVADLWTDIGEFQDSVRRGLRDDREGRRPQAGVLLRRAVDLYGDDFLVAEQADWVTGTREFFKSLMIVALVALRDHALRAGDLAEAIELAQRTLDLDRFHEDSYRVLIEIHCQRGEVERARSWYQLCWHRLQAELSIEPSRETSEAIMEILRGRRPARHAGRSPVLIPFARELAASLAAPLAEI
jgi:DNA-binding SARP family transcriptional activator